MAESTHYSVDDIDLSPLTESDIESVSRFSCGVEELDDFFHDEIWLCAKYHYLIPYKCILSETGEIIGLFTLANDVIALEEDDKIDFPQMAPEYNWIFKRQCSYPAVNIGHLGIKHNCQSKGLGQIIVNFVAATFRNNPIAGCQFISVDALNNQKTINFYAYKVGFEFLTVYDIGKHTRRMYLDIFTNPSNHLNE